MTEITMMEFVQKYGIDYNTVYHAASLITSITGGYRGRMFDEKELYTAVVKYLQRRLQKADKERNAVMTLLERMVEKRPE